MARRLPRSHREHATPTLTARDRATGRKWVAICKAQLCNLAHDPAVGRGSGGTVPGPSRSFIKPRATEQEQQ